MNFESFKQEVQSTESKASMNYADQKMNQPSYMNDMNCCPKMEPTPMCCDQFSPAMGGPCMPIYECPRENVCHRYICYEVPHIMPCNTRIINHHVYRHTYRPEYTCCEENVVSNVYDRPCC